MWDEADEVALAAKRDKGCQCGHVAHAVDVVRGTVPCLTEGCGCNNFFPPRQAGLVAPEAVDDLRATLAAYRQLHGNDQMARALEWAIAKLDWIARRGMQ